MISGFENLKRRQDKGSCHAEVVEFSTENAPAISGFREVFLGNDPRLGWMIILVASGIVIDPVFHCSQRLGI